MFSRESVQTWESDLRDADLAFPSLDALLALVAAPTSISGVVSLTDVSLGSLFSVEDGQLEGERALLTLLSGPAALALVALLATKIRK